MAGLESVDWGEKEKERRGYSSVHAIDPRDGGRWQLLLSDGKMDSSAKKGMGAAHELIDTVRWTLLHPSRIFMGLRDTANDIFEDNWLCYVSVPPHAYDYKTGKKRAPWENEVFMVYVTDERQIYLWYWDEQDGREDRCPIDFETRFREKVLG